MGECRYWEEWLNYMNPNNVETCEVYANIFHVWWRNKSAGEGIKMQSTGKIIEVDKLL